jgi:hypothetical protein
MAVQMPQRAPPSASPRPKRRRRARAPVVVRLLPSCAQVLFQRAEYEDLLHGGADPQADDTSRKDVSDQDHFNDSIPGHEIGEVSNPLFVRTPRLDVPIHPITPARRDGRGYRQSNCAQSDQAVVWLQLALHFEMGRRPRQPAHPGKVDRDSGCGSLREQLNG